MAIQYIGNNLITLGGNGTFETDPSGWGLGTSYIYQLSRVTSQKKEGAHSCQLRFTTNASFQFNFLGLSIPVENGKKYEVSIWLKSHATTPIAADGVVHQIDTFVAGDQRIEKLSFNSLTIAETKADWVRLELRFRALETFTVGLGVKTASVLGADYFNNGILYLDKMEGFQYSESGDGGGDPGGGDPGGEPDPEAQGIRDIFFSKNPIVTTQVHLGFTLPNLAFKNIVYVGTPDGTDYQPVLPMVLAPDKAGISKFYVEAAFRGLLNAVPPNYNEGEIRRLTDRMARFQHQSGKISGIETDPATYTTNGDYLVLLGGLSKEAYPEVDFFNTYLKINKNFLTWAPKTKKVDRAQEEYLYWLIWDKSQDYVVPAELNLKVKVYYRDNTIEEAITKTYANPGLGWLLQIPAGYVNSGALALNPDKQCLKYELWLEDDDAAVISEVRTYEVEQDTAPYTRYFLFLNSLGGFDTLRTTGFGKKETTTEREEVELFLPDTYDLIQGQFRLSNVESRNSSEVSTGHYSKAYVDYLQEMLLSTQVYEITGGRRVPVIIKNQTVTLHTDKVNLWYIRFQVQSAFSNTSFTPHL